MAPRYEVEVTVASAKDIKNVNWRDGAVRAYAVVWVDPARKCSTRADEEGDTCPQWNEKLVLPLDRPIEDSTLHIDVVHAKSPDEDVKPLIGSAKLSLRDVADEAGVGSGARVSRSLRLRRPSGRPHGKIEVEIAIRDPRLGAPDPYAAPYGVRDKGYGAPAPGYGYSAPPPAYAAPPPSGYPYSAPAPPPSGYQYGSPAPPQSGYQYGAAPPPPSGYQYGAAAAPPSGYQYGAAAPPQGAYGQSSYGQAAYGQEEKKGSKFGVGTGVAVGAVGGLLGGLVLAEGFDKLEDHIADEAAERVENDGDYYDDGGDDGGW